MKRSTFHARGFIFPSRLPFSDPEQYTDFAHKTWFLEEIQADLKAGNLPLGLVIQPEGGLPGVIVPDPTGGQMVKRLAEVLA
jgi:hypothetical protein